MITLQTITDLLHHLHTQGVDVAQTQLVATVALLPSGTKDHYSGGVVQVFSPVAVHADLLAGPDEEPIAAIRFDAQTVKRSESGILLDSDDFDRHVQLDGALAGASAAAAGRLVRELVTNHREITDKVSSAFEHIEADPNEIARITAKRFTLEIGLERLAKFVALNDELLGLLIEHGTPAAQARVKQIGFEKLMLKEGFIKQPCTQELYNDLRSEFASNGYSTGMDFMDFYQWFRRSESLLDASGNIFGEVRKDMVKAIKAWHETSGDKPDFREQTLYWACRNFEVHPRHRRAVEQLMNEAITPAGNKPLKTRKP